MFLAQGAAQWHAALNDFPALLFPLSFVLDLVGSATRRESLRAAGFWTLLVGVVGAVAAVVSGLLAEEAIEHGELVHALMERHEVMGIALTVFFGALAAWRVWRRGTLGEKQQPTYLMLAGVGALFVLWTALLGGRMVYDHGAGIPTEVMEQAITDRESGRGTEPQRHD